MNLQTLVYDVTADGVISAEEAKQIRDEIFADGVISREEANALIQINNKVSGSDNAPEWDELFVEGVSSHVLNDETSPGVIDQEEAKWLIDSVYGDGQVDDTERKLLAALKMRATSYPETLAQKFMDLGI